MLLHTVWSILRKLSPPLFALLAPALLMTAVPDAMASDTGKLTLQSGKSVENVDRHAVFARGDSENAREMIARHKKGEFTSDFAKIADGHSPYSSLWTAVRVKNASKRADRADDRWTVVIGVNRPGRADIFVSRSSGEIEQILGFDALAAYDPDSFNVKKKRSRTVEIAAGEQILLQTRTWTVGLNRPEISMLTAGDLAKTAAADGAIFSAFYAVAIFGLIMMIAIHIALRNSLGVKYAIWFGCGLMTIAMVDKFPWFFFYPAYPKYHVWFDILSNYAFVITGFYAAAAAMKALVPNRKITNWIARIVLAPFLTFALIPFLNWPLSWILVSIWTSLALLVHFVPLYFWNKEAKNRRFLAAILLGLVAIAISAIMYMQFTGNLNGIPVAGTLVKIVYLFIGSSTMAALTAGIIGLRRDHEAALEQQVQMSEENAEQTRRLLETEKNYSRARDQAALRQRQLATASHDLKQPLSSLRMSLETIAGDMSEDVRRNMKEALDYLESLSGGYLEDGRPDEPDAAEEGEPYELGMILKTVRQMFSEEAVSKGIELRVVSSSQKTQIDPLALMRIVSNLTSNAIKYTEVGKVLVGVRRGGGNAAIQIIDTGRGMTAADIERFRGAYNKGENSEGEGLGLAICHDLASKHGLDIGIRSEPEKGSMISISLPLAVQI